MFGFNAKHKGEAVANLMGCAINYIILIYFNKKIHYVDISLSF